MGNYHDPHELAKVQRLRAEAAKRQLRLGHRELANTMYQEAYQLLSGPVKQADLTAMGHPYGRKAGINGALGRQRRIQGAKALMPVLPINVQTNRLREALRLFQRNQGDRQIFVLQVLKSMAAYARFILNPEGTVKMVARPFWQALYKSWKRKNFDLLIKTRQAQKRIT